MTVYGSVEARPRPSPTARPRARSVDSWQLTPHVGAVLNINVNDNDNVNENAQNLPLTLSLTLNWCRPPVHGRTLTLFIHVGRYSIEVLVLAPAASLIHKLGFRHRSRSMSVVYALYLCLWLCYAVPGMEVLVRRPLLVTSLTWLAGQVFSEFVFHTNKASLSRVS